MVSNRVTREDLADLCKRINELTNSPTTMGIKLPRGEVRHNVGHFHCQPVPDGGGYEFRRIDMPYGGSVNVLGTGAIPRKDMFNRLNAFIKGIETGKAL